MEDSPAKTIAFLRARLLAERSVSRTARQRAYELAKKVTELEKQLKFVSLQRKKAEKATVDVLAILENHGRNDLSEPFESSSDQEEMSSDFKDHKHMETSTHGKVEESDTEGFSGSEVESSSANGRSLSWKSGKSASSRFLEKKYMDASRRRRNSFTSTGSSPRRVGKSCRQIRHKEHRSVADGSRNDGHRSEDVQISGNVATETSIGEGSEKEIPTSSCNGHISQNHGSERDMERALEHQAQFIAQYEEEEKAQREWEDKFRENNGSTPDSCDPGTHSDVTEERDEIKTSSPVSAPPCSTHEVTSGGQEIITEPLLDHKDIDMKNQELDNQNYPPDTPQASSSQDSSLLRRVEQPAYEPSQENSDNLGSVLEALQQAKLSLKQNFDKLPLVESGPSIPTFRSGEKFPVPFSPAGLFRLPTDYYEYGRAANSLTYDSRLSLTNYPTGGPFISSPSLSGSAASLDDRFSMVPAFPYDETRLETPIPTPTRHPSAYTPRPLTLDPRFSALDPRLSVQPPAATFTDPRLDVGTGPFAYDPRSDIGSALTGDRYRRMGDHPRPGPGAGVPPSSRYGRVPGGDVPLGSHSLYDDYTRRSTYK